MTKKAKKYKKGLKRAVELMKKQNEALLKQHEALSLMNKKLKKAYTANQILESALKMGVVSLDLSDVARMVKTEIEKESALPKAEGM